MKIVIIGAGGHGRVVLDIIRNNHQFKVSGFLDSNDALHNRVMDGVEILGDLSLLKKLPEMGIGAAIVAIGDNRVRKAYAEICTKNGISLVSAIHPSACIAGNAHIGRNVVIAAGANICAHAVIEDSVILNTGSIVDHESHIHQAAHICPGVKLAGHVTVKHSAFVGIGATIIQGVTVGEYAVVGAGAVVLQDVPRYSTVVGVPARIAKTSHIGHNTDKTTNLSLSDQLNRSTAELEPARSLVVRPKRKRPVRVPLSPQEVIASETSPCPASATCPS